MLLLEGGKQICILEMDVPNCPAVDTFGVGAISMPDVPDRVCL